MFEDIRIFTERIYKSAFMAITGNCRFYYDSYRHLESFIKDINTLAVHYLTLKLDEEYLQNSHFGSPAKKWKFF